MPTTVKIRRSGTASATPSALEHGEIAINYADGKVFWKNASDVITSFTFQSYALASHTHSISDVTGLQTALDGKASSSHTHSISDVTGLQTALDGKAASSHTHSISDVTGLQTALDGKASSSHTHAASDITSGTLDIARIANDAVTYAKIQNVSATSRILGRSSAGAGDVEELDAATARTVMSVQPTASPAFTGAATFANTGDVVPLTVTNAGTANSFVVNDASGDTSPFVIDAAGNVGIGVTPTSLPLTVFSFATSDADKATMLLNGTVSSGQSFAGIRFTHNVFSTGWAADIRCVDTGNFGGILSFRTSATGSATATPTERLKIDASGTATFAGQVLVTAGSKTTCSVAPTGDPDTGMFFPLANTLALSTGDVERVRVDASGNVGIGTGTGSLAHALDCNGEFRLRGTGGSTEAGKFHLYYASASNRATITTGSSGQIIFEAGTTSPGSRAVILEGGNFGIGTTSPERRLVVSNGGAEGLEFFVASAANVNTINSFNRSSGTWNKFAVGCSTLEFFVGSGTTSAISVDANAVVTMAGVYDDIVGATNRDLFIDSTGKLGYVSSIRESKTDIVTLDDVSWLSALSPVSYRYRKKNADGTYSAEADGVTDYGLIAEDVEAVKPELCFYDEVDGEPQLRGVTYSKLITPMLRYIQQLEQRIAALEERING
jgi:hypothetical protein